MRIQVGMPTEMVNLDELDVNFASDPALADAVKVLENPKLVLYADSAGPTGGKSATFALGHKFAAVTIPAPENATNVAAVTIESIPHIIAILMGLGAGPHDEEERPTTLANGELAKLLETTPETLRPDQHETLNGVFTSPWITWSLKGMAPADPAPRTILRVIGSQEKGWWKLEETGTTTRATRTASVHIWEQVAQTIQTLKTSFL